MVGSNRDRQIGFLSDLRRTNVAMTRAKHKLIMIGDSSTLREPLLRKVIGLLERQILFLGMGVPVRVLENVRSGNSS